MEGGKRKSRWAAGGAAQEAQEAQAGAKRARRSRFADAPPTAASPAAAAAAGGAKAKAKAAALQLSISERLAALKARKKQQPPQPVATSTSTSTSTTDAPPDAAAAARPTKRARVYEIDLADTSTIYSGSVRAGAREGAGGRAATGPAGRRKGTGAGGGGGDNPYLAHVSQMQGEALSPAPAAARSSPDEGELLDGRLAGRSTGRTRRRALKFVEPGTYVALAERRRERASNAEQAGFVSGRKEGTSVRGVGFGVDLGVHLGVGGDSGGDHYGGGGAEGPLSLATLPPRIDGPDPADEAVRRDDVVPAILEWWDLELLPSGLRKEVAQRQTSQMKTAAVIMGRGPADGTGGENGKDTEERNDGNALNQLEERCHEVASVAYCKTSSLVQHPVPVRPPNAPTGPPRQAVLHLTKKEMKRQRKLRRVERQREMQDMQAAGLIPPPEPRLTLSNFMRVLGDQAVMDPSQMEAKVQEQIQARRIKHEKMNEERRLTRDQRREKRARKLTEDTSQGVSVALFLVRDMGHRYHRTKVDLNAQQSGISGGVLECQRPDLALVIAEGGPRAIKRFIRLMTIRMKWTGENLLGLGAEGAGGGYDVDVDDGEDHAEDEDHREMGIQDGERPQKFNVHNSCELVWTGMGAKRMFHGFVFQKCETSHAARRVLEAKGVANYWDQVLVHASGRGSEFNFKLGNGGVTTYM